MSLQRDRVVYDAGLGYGPPEDKPWVISHEYELDQGKALEEVRLKRYRRLLGPPIKETTLSYFDRKLWATAIEADCEGYLFDPSKPNGVDAVMQIMEERCSDSVRVDILMFRRDARTLALQHPHSTVLSSANGAVSLRQRSQSYGGGSAGAPMTHVEWRDWVVLQDAYEPKLGIVKRTGTVDEETRLVWVASSPQCPKSTLASEIVTSALAGLKTMGILLSKTVIQPYTTGIFPSDRKTLSVGTMLSYRDTGADCSVVPLHALLSEEESGIEAQEAALFEEELSARTEVTKTAAVVHNVDLGLDDGVLYLSQFFTEESKRMRRHCIHGCFETTAIQRKLLLNTVSSGTVKFELFEQEFFCIKEPAIRDLTSAQRFSAFVALILTMGDDTHWLLHNECQEEIGKFFSEISKFSKFALKSTDEELGLGAQQLLKNHSKSRHVLYEVFDTYKRMFNGAGQKFNWRPGKPKSEAWKAAQSASQRHRYKRQRIAAESAAHAVIQATAGRLRIHHEASAASAFASAGPRGGPSHGTPSTSEASYSSAGSSTFVGDASAASFASSGSDSDGDLGDSLYDPTSNS